MLAGRLKSKLHLTGHSGPAGALYSLIENKALREELKINGREIEIEQYSVEANKINT